MRNVHAAEAASEALIRDRLVSELEHELVSEARQTGGELIPANTFQATPVNTFQATAVNAGPPRPAA